jgi:hypothetical protein
MDQEQLVTPDTFLGNSIVTCTITDLCMKTPKSEVCVSRETQILLTSEDNSLHAHLHLQVLEFRTMNFNKGITPKYALHATKHPI